MRVPGSLEAERLVSMLRVLRVDEKTTVTSVRDGHRRLPGLRPLEEHRRPEVVVLRDRRPEKNGVWRVLRRHGLNTRSKRLGLVAGYAAFPEPTRPEPPPQQHLEVERPGELVQMDCFYVGRLAGTKGGRVAVHGHRRRLRVPVGGAPRHPAEPVGAVDITAREAGWPGSSPDGAGRWRR